jgi:hypothetical protein
MPIRSSYLELLVSIVEIGENAMLSQVLTRLLLVEPSGFIQVGTFEILDVNLILVFVVGL